MSVDQVKKVRFSEVVQKVEVAPAVGLAADAAAVSEAGAPAADKKHTLDSDEEDEPDRNGCLAEADIEGQEEATIENDNGIHITPFNMKEEMEEGYFDANGTFIFNDEKEAHDNWLDNVNWKAVQTKEQQHLAGGAEESDTDSEPDMPEQERAGIYRRMSELLLPGETVAAGIKRLGGGANRSLTASQRLRLRKAGGGSAADSEEAAANRRLMLELCSLADRLVSAGDMAAYELDSERLLRMSGQQAATGANEFDMFADDGPAAAAASAAEAEGPTEAKKPRLDASSEWYLKEAESSEPSGPHSTEQMLRWSQEAKWPGGRASALVRRGTEGQFYSSERIDFDLYV